MIENRLQVRVAEWHLYLVPTQQILKLKDPSN
jgi:hypothetical protein